MTKLLMLKGLPASGKSKFAKELAANDDNWKRVNKDDLRAMIDGGVWSHYNEENITAAERAMAGAFLTAGFNVVVDDTNFHPDHEEAYRKIAEETGADFEVKVFDTGPRECILRDAARPNSVGSKVIMNMYFKYARPKSVEYSMEDEDAYIFDIDGTLAIMGDRSPYDWKNVGVDKVNLDIRNILNELSKNHFIIVVSGRDEVCRPETEAWLKLHDITYGELLMRHEGDNRKDVEVKRDIYERHIKGQYNILGVFDDRDQVVDMWRGLGLTCLQANYGSF